MNIPTPTQLHYGPSPAEEALIESAIQERLIYAFRVGYAYSAPLSDRVYDLMQRYIGWLTEELIKSGWDVHLHEAPTTYFTLWPLGEAPPTWVDSKGVNCDRE